MFARMQRVDHRLDRRVQKLERNDDHDQRPPKRRRANDRQGDERERCEGAMRAETGLASPCFAKAGECKRQTLRERSIFQVSHDVRRETPRQARTRTSDDAEDWIDVGLGLLTAARYRRSARISRMFAAASMMLAIRRASATGSTALCETE